MRSRAVAIGAACLLAGCTTGPDYVTPNLWLASAYATASPKGTVVAPETRWWEGLADPTLNRLIEAAQVSNLTVAQAVERVREARANAKASGTDGLPQLDAAGASGTEGADGSSASTTVSGDLAAGWEIDLFGKYRRNREAARATAEAYREDLYAARLALLGDVATAYVDARGYENRLAVARKTRTAQAETLALVRAQLAAGSGTTLEVAQAEGDLASTEASIPTLEAAFHSAVNRLATLLDLPSGTIRMTFSRGAAVPSPRRSVSGGVPADLLRNRPDVRAAERTLAAATADIGVAEADLYPSLSLSGSITVSAASAAGLGNGTGTWALGPTLTVPVFDAGRRKALVEVERSQAARQYLDYREIVIEAVEEVENALVDFRSEKRRRAALGKSVAAYDRAAGLSRRLYEAGSATFLEVLDAQRSLYDAEDSLVESEVAMAEAYISLCKALGGGWAGFI